MEQISKKLQSDPNNRVWEGLTAPVTEQPLTQENSVVCILKGPELFEEHWGFVLVFVLQLYFV